MDSIQLRPHDTSLWEKHTLPSPQTLHPDDGRRSDIDIRNRNLQNDDLSMYNIQDISFDDKTIWPTDPKKLPQGFEYKDEIMELGKNPGLGVRSLHARGIDGTGMRMAIIDQWLSNHQEYHDNVVHYEEIGFNPELMGKHKDEVVGQMHAAALASISVGKNIGVAPNAQLYFFATSNQMAYKQEGAKGKYADDYAKALERILDINKTLPDDKKIQVVSVSWGGQINEAETQGCDKWWAALEKAKKAGLFVLTTASSKEYGLTFNGMGRDSLSYPDDTHSYDKQPYWHTKQSAIEHATSGHRSIVVPMDDRTTASPTGVNDYVHYVCGGMSWATPWLAGMFVLARQVDPTVTPEHFWEVALKTGILSKEVGGSIIQPVALIETLEKERFQTLEKRQENTDATHQTRKTKGLLSLQQIVTIQNKKLTEQKGLKK